MLIMVLSRSNNTTAGTKMLTISVAVVRRELDSVCLTVISYTDAWATMRAEIEYQKLANGNWILFLECIRANSVAVGAPLLGMMVSLVRS
jgi:hypothetical protein